MKSSSYMKSSFFKNSDNKNSFKFDICSRLELFSVFICFCSFSSVLLVWGFFNVHLLDYTGLNRIFILKFYFVWQDKANISTMQTDYISPGKRKHLLPKIARLGWMHHLPNSVLIGMNNPMHILLKCKKEL